MLKTSVKQFRRNKFIQKYYFDVKSFKFEMKMKIFYIVYVFVIINVLNAEPLDDYVFAPDPNYKYELLRTYNFIDHDVYILNMTSQKWKDGLMV